MGKNDEGYRHYYTLQTENDELKRQLKAKEAERTTLIDGHAKLLEYEKDLRSKNTRLQAENKKLLGLLKVAKMPPKPPPNPGTKPPKPVIM